VTFGPLAADPGRTEWLAGVRRQVGMLHEACDAAGREPATLRRAALVSLEVGWAQESLAAWDDFCGDISALGFTDVIVHWPRPHDAHLPGPPPAVFDEISNRQA
jgi:hypothetical protein